MVNVLNFDSDDSSSNPAETYSFSIKFVLVKNENKQKEAGVGPFLYKTISVEHDQGKKTILGQWLWLSWYSGCFRNQRSTVRIPSSEKFIYFY